MADSVNYQYFKTLVEELIQRRIRTLPNCSKKGLEKSKGRFSCSQWIIEINEEAS